MTEGGHCFCAAGSFAIGDCKLLAATSPAAAIRVDAATADWNNPALFSAQKLGGDYSSLSAGNQGCLLRALLGARDAGLAPA
jgi:hypothetical protein